MIAATRHDRVIAVDPVVDVQRSNRRHFGMRFRDCRRRPCAELSSMRRAASTEPGRLRPICTLEGALLDVLLTDDAYQGGVTSTPVGATVTSQPTCYRFRRRRTRCPRSRMRISPLGDIVIAYETIGARSRRTGQAPR